MAGVRERVDCDGDVVEALDLEAAERAVRFLVGEKKVEAIAVSFLWSFFNPSHERAVRDLIGKIAPQTYVTLSSDIAPVPGEYERTSTTVINAYAGRITRDYLNALEQLLGENGYRGQTMVMQGYGGLLPAGEAAERAVGMIECGPAAGVIGAKFLGDLMGDKDIIAADMGGTTFKVGVIQGGEIEYAREPMVDRFHYVAPKIDVVSIGAGGGSIVQLDPKTKLPTRRPALGRLAAGPDLLRPRRHRADAHRRDAADRLHGSGAFPGRLDDARPSTAPVASSRRRLPIRSAYRSRRRRSASTASPPRRSPT